MSKRINPTYQAKKQKIKDFLSLKPEDRKSYLFVQENPNFPVQFIPDRLSIGLLSIGFTDLFASLSKEEKTSLLEIPTFGMVS